MLKSQLEKIRNSVGKPFPAETAFGKEWLRGVTVEASDELLVLDFKVEEDMVDSSQMLHRPVIAAIIDEMMGSLVFGTGRRLFTQNLSIEYYQSVKVNNTLRASAKVIKHEGKIIYLECNIYKSKEIVASGHSFGICPQKKLN
jgi:uncharacterized protein (TIGR00369 family)